uniref:Uncharacterized protein n=2 Tax=Micrurus lemniscatus lemniscatus TaxID=129467 RepID=A0A2D4IGZ7_MICLE
MDPVCWKQEADSVNRFERAGKHYKAVYKSKCYCYCGEALEGRRSLQRILGGGYECAKCLNFEMLHLQPKMLSFKCLRLAITRAVLSSEHSYRGQNIFSEVRKVLKVMFQASVCNHHCSSYFATPKKTRFKGILGNRLLKTTVPSGFLLQTTLLFISNSLGHKKNLE